MNYRDRAHLLHSRYYAMRTSMFSLSYQIFNRIEENIYNIEYYKKLNNNTVNLAGYKIANLISKEYVYYVDNIFPNKLFPNGFYYFNWKPLAILNEKYFIDIPMDLKERAKLIRSIDGISDMTIKAIETYSTDSLSSNISGEILRSIIIPQDMFPYLICDFPRRWTCKRVVVVRDIDFHKVLHVIRDMNQSFYSPISICVSRRMVKADSALILFSALHALDNIRPEMNN